MKFNYYKIINKTTGKNYLGITEKSLIERVEKQHFARLRNNSHPNYKLLQDWNLYGENDFYYELFENLDFETIEQGYLHEKELIEKFDCINSGYNILEGGLENPMYTKSVYEKMVQTKRKSVPNIYQLEEIEENVFQVIAIFPSQKSIPKILGEDFNQANIQKAIKNHRKSKDYYWVTENDIHNFNLWKPARTKMSPTAELNDKGEIIKVHHNQVDFCKEYGWHPEVVGKAIKRNGKAHGIKFISISEEEYYKNKPITLIKTVCNDYSLS